MEKLFRKALEEVTVEPPARVWEGICAHFDMKRRRQRRLFWYGGVAAAVALLLAIGLVVRDGAEGRLSPTPLAENGRHIIHLEDNKVAAVMSSVASIPPFGRRGAETERLTPMDNGEGIALALAGETGRRELKNGRTRELSIRLVNGEAVENQKKYLALLNESATDNPEKATRQPKEEPVTSQSIQTPKEETREKPERAPRERKNREAGRFSVGGYVSPGYTSGMYHQSNTTSRSAQFSDEQMSGLFNVTGGVNFSVRPTKRISIETGVGYSRMGQRTDEMSVYAPSVTMSAKDGDKVVTSNVQVATPLGNVKSKAQAAVYTMDANIALKDADMPEGSIEQQFDAIEIQQEIAVGGDRDHGVLRPLRQGESAAEIRMEVAFNSIRREPNPAGGHIRHSSKFQVSVPLSSYCNTDSRFFQSPGKDLAQQSGVTRFPRAVPPGKANAT